MQFLEPHFLALGIVALLPWVGPWRSRDAVHALIRSALLLTVAVALAQPVTLKGDSRQHQVLVVDRSERITDADDAAMRESVESFLTTLADIDGTATLIEVGGASRPAIEVPGASSAALRRVRMDGDGAHSAALQAAARAIPRDMTARVTYFTDGASALDPTGAETAAAARQLEDAGYGFDVVPLPGVPDDLRLFDLSVPQTLRVGLETTVYAEAVGGGQVVNGTLTAGGRELASFDGVAVEGRARIPLTFTPDEGGFVDASLALTVASGTDPRGGDLELAVTLAVEDPIEVMYVGSRMQGGDRSLAQLVGQGFAVRAITDPAAGELDRFDLVMIDDQPADGLSEDFQTALVDHVASRGTGLIAAGGEASFGPGGYHEQPIETVLPVEFVQKEEKRDPSTTLVVIIDTSGSMGGNRVQLAKEVSRLAIRRLLPHDKVGLVEFYGAKRWAVPIQPASNSIEIERALNRLDAGGGTVILPAIEEAYYGLKNVRTRYKHVLILTDGGVETGAFEPLLRRMADDGMTVSTVLIGPDAHSEFLVNIANWGQGRFYSVPNRFNLPEILLKQPASAKLPAYRPGVTTVRASGGPSWWGDVDTDTVPPVGGYVETRLRPGAERVLETSEESHPVLASWRYGLGRVTAMTTEPTGAGTEPWTDWDGYGEMLARVLARTAADSAEPYGYALSRESGGAVLVAERRANGTGLDPRARASTDGGTTWTELTFTSVAPDRLEARLALAGTQQLRVHAVTARDGATVGRPTRLVLEPYLGGARELQASPDVRSLLASHVAATDGVSRTLDGVRTEGPLPARLSRAAEGPAMFRELAPLFALLALFLYLFDIAYRRWPRRRVLR